MPFDRLRSLEWRATKPTAAARPLLQVGAERSDAQRKLARSRRLALSAAKPNETPPVLGPDDYFDPMDTAALRSIAGWSFAPGTKDGKPTAQQVVVPVDFQLIHDAARVSPLLEASAIASIVLRTLGSLILVAGVVWSWVLGKRKSNLWLWGLVPVWILTYPVFVATHWSLAKRNLVVVLLGIAIASVGALPARLGRVGT